jgi:ABC-2 type transport system permease protein
MRPSRRSSCSASASWSWEFAPGSARRIQLIGSVVRNLDWLRDTSIFAHVEPAPATNPDWGTGAIVVLLGVMMAVAGALAFQRRDIEYA